MKRFIVALKLAVGLVGPTVAVARRVATGSTRTAIERGVAQAYEGPQRCRLVEVTTRDRNAWGRLLRRRRLSLLPTLGVNGVDIAHRAHGRWHNVTSGSADIPCGHLEIPAAVILTNRREGERHAQRTNVHRPHKSTDHPPARSRETCHAEQTSCLGHRGQQICPPSWRTVVELAEQIDSERANEVGGSEACAARGGGIGEACQESIPICVRPSAVRSSRVARP